MKVIVYLLGNNAQMPNVKGGPCVMLCISKLLKLDLKTSGTGYVTSQSIEKGQDLQEGRYTRTRIRTAVTTVNRGEYELIQAFERVICK